VPLCPRVHLPRLRLDGVHVSDRSPTRARPRHNPYQRPWQSHDSAVVLSPHCRSPNWSTPEASATTPWTHTPSRKPPGRMIEPSATSPARSGRPAVHQSHGPYKNRDPESPRVPRTRRHTGGVRVPLPTAVEQKKRGEEVGAVKGEVGRRGGRKPPSPPCCQATDAATKLLPAPETPHRATTST
jgi:hypothetical protein